MVIGTKQEYLLQINFDYLIKYASETKLYRNYRRHFTKKDFVNTLLRNLTKDQCIELNNAFLSNIPPEEIAQSFLYENPTSNIIKDKLIEYINKNAQGNEVIFSEFPVLNSRTDVTRINGSSYNYEIKTNRDKITRLQNQMETFTTLFEKNFVICPKNSYELILENLPFANVGIIVYDIQKNNIRFKTKKTTRKSDGLLSENQLKIFTITGLRKLFKKRIGSANSLSRTKLTDNILSQLSDDEINKEFKNYLKEKFSHQNNALITDYY